VLQSQVSDLQKDLARVDDRCREANGSLDEASDTLLRQAGELKVPCCPAVMPTSSFASSLAPVLAYLALHVVFNDSCFPCTLHSRLSRLILARLLSRR
jgi:hypothetical protein